MNWLTWIYLGAAVAVVLALASGVQEGLQRRRQDKLVRTLQAREDARR